MLLEKRYENLYDFSTKAQEAMKEDIETRKAERKKLNKLRDDVLSKNKGKLKNKKRNKSIKGVRLMNSTKITIPRN